MQPELTNLELGNEQRLRHEVANTARTNSRGERMRGQRFRVLLGLVDLCQGRPQWSGTLAELGTAAGVSARTAQAAVADAQALQFVLIEKRPGRPSIYTPSVVAIMDHHRQQADQAARIQSPPSSSPRPRTPDPRQLVIKFQDTAAPVPAMVRTRRSRRRILCDLGAELLPVQTVMRVLGLLIELVQTFRAETPATASAPLAEPQQPAGVTMETIAATHAAPLQPRKVAGVTPEESAYAPEQPRQKTPATHASQDGHPGKTDGMHDHEHVSSIQNSTMTMTPDFPGEKGSLGKRNRPEGRKPLSAGGKSLKAADLNDPVELQRLWRLNEDRLPPQVDRPQFFALAAALGPLRSLTTADGRMTIRSPIGAFWAILGGQLICGQDMKAILQACPTAAQKAANWLMILDGKPVSAPKPVGAEAPPASDWGGEAWVAEQRKKLLERKKPAGELVTT